MNATKAVLMIVASVVIFTMLGGAVGFGLGRFAPNYYRTIARAGGDPGFDPLSFGIGQGVTQGLTAGIAVGVVLAVVLAWLESRLPAKTLTTKSEE